MSDNAHLTSSELAGVAVHAVVRIARNRFRWALAGIAILLLVCAVLGTIVHSQNSTISGLQSKSAEQTVAEVQLRDDVNKLSALNHNLTADHSIALSVYCSIAETVHDTFPAVAKNCSKA